MAEIHLEKKKAGMGWLWILIVLVLALIVWWIWATNDEGAASLAPGTSVAEWVAEDSVRAAPDAGEPSGILHGTG